MKKMRLSDLLFLALCADLGLFSKRLISPFANVLTDMLRIPGGIGTGFSLMFLVVAASLVSGRWCATFMSVVQSMIALSLGMVGSMGALSPIGYVVPGLVIDLTLLVAERIKAERLMALTLANMLSSAAASLTANAIVFHLWGVPLALYLCVSLCCGAICGMLANTLAARLGFVLEQQGRQRRENQTQPDA